MVLELLLLFDEVSDCVLLLVVKIEFMFIGFSFIAI